MAAKQQNINKNMYQILSYMIINKCEIVNNAIIKNVKKGSPDTTCSEPTVTMKAGNKFPVV